MSQALPGWRGIIEICLVKTGRKSPWWRDKMAVCASYIALASGYTAETGRAIIYKFRAYTVGRGVVGYLGGRNPPKYPTQFSLNCVTPKVNITNLHPYCQHFSFFHKL